MWRGGETPLKCLATISTCQLQWPPGRGEKVWAQTLIWRKEILCGYQGKGVRGCTGLMQRKWPALGETSPLLSYKACLWPHLVQQQGTYSCFLGILLAQPARSPLKPQKASSLKIIDSPRRDGNSSACVSFWDHYCKRLQKGFGLMEVICDYLMQQIALPVTHSFCHNILWAAAANSERDGAGSQAKTVPAVWRNP